MKKKAPKTYDDAPDFYFGGGKPRHVRPLPTETKNKSVSNVKTLRDLKERVSKRYV